MEGKIIEANRENLDEWVSLALTLWPDYSKEGLTEEFINLMKSDQEKGMLYKMNNETIGFINVSIRNDYVNGSSTSPVGFIEGIYVKPNYRKKGIAKQLVQAGEQWALRRGCSEMGSDVELDNIDSLHFHQQIGYQEEERVICLIKKIKGVNNG